MAFGYGSGTVRVTGLRPLIHAADAAGKATSRAVRDRLRKVGEAVRASGERRFSRYDSDSASGYGVSVRRTGMISVEQRKRKTTGKRPDYGALQMTRALIPALDEHSDDVVRETEEAMDDIADLFESL